MCAHTHTHTLTNHPKHRYMHTRARKVLPRRTSATLSSLKPAKYSPSAAGLSKLPTQARKRHQLPDRGVGRPAMGKGPHRAGGETAELRVHRKGSPQVRAATLVTDPRQWDRRSNHIPMKGMGDADCSHLFSQSFWDNTQVCMTVNEVKDPSSVQDPGLELGHILGQIKAPLVARLSWDKDQGSVWKEVWDCLDHCQVLVWGPTHTWNSHLLAPLPHLMPGTGSGRAI